MRSFTFLARLSLVGALLICVAAAGRQSAQRTDPRATLQAALLAKKEVVLVVKPAGRAETEDEAYGDWADRLNRFATHDGKDFKIIVVTRTKFAQMVDEPKAKENYAMLFLLDATHGLFYDGMLLDYSDYQTGAGYLKRKNFDGKTMPAYGLHEVSVRIK